MELRHQLQHFREEHDEILRFLREWDAALQLVASEKVQDRRKGLAQLLEMEDRLMEIREHCDEEERSVQSPFHLYLDDNALEQLREEHARLDQLSEAYRNTLRLLIELPLAQGLIQQGQRLLGQLRHHIAFEEGLLKQIEDGNAAQERVFLGYTHSAE